MTISTSASAIIVAGNGLTTAFNFSFIGDTAADIFVSYIDANGNLNLLSPTQYSVALNPASANQLWGIGGVITYPLSGSPIASGTYLLIQRILPLKQQVSIQNQGNFYPKVTEQALDLLEMQIQQVSARTGQLRGTWASGILYSYGDFVLDGANGNNTGNYYLCIQENTSSGSWTNDLAQGYWSLALNVQTIAATASAAATAGAAVAQAAAVVATTQAGIATTQANNSSVSAGQSAASALAAAGTLFGTSSSSNTIGTGAKTFITQAGLAINPTGGGFLTIANTVAPANYFHGQVTSYAGTTLIINVLDVGGSGTFSSWNISPSGPQGTSGGGSGTVNAGTTNQVAFYAGNGTTVSGDVNLTAIAGAVTAGVAGTAQGSLALAGSTSGATTLAAPTVGSGTMTLPAATDRLVGRATTDTLTNKTINGANNTLNVRLANDVSGNLPVTNLGSGTGATASTAWFGDGTWKAPSSTGFTQLTPQIFSTVGAATYTPTAGMKYCIVEVVSGGGGGGGSSTSVNGGAGGTSSFGILISITGGAGGFRASIGGAGGSSGGVVTATGVFLSVNGQVGGPGIASTFGGSGGSNLFGFGAAINTGTNGTAGSGYGSGGSGFSSGSGGGQSGGYCKQIFSAAAIGASQSIAIGAAGAAGLPAATGGIGRQGVIIITEFI